MFSCRIEKRGLISLIWPDAIIYEEDLPFFLPNSKVIFYSNKMPRIEDERITQVRKETGRSELSTRPGFIEAMKYVLGDLTDWEEDLFLGLDTDEFWVLAKARLVAPFFKREFEANPEFSVVSLFDVLFKGISKTFPIYSKMRTSYKSTMLSLMTMMISTTKPTETRFSQRYLSTLRRNAIHIEHFKKCVLSYIESKQTEQDFLTFLEEVYPY